MSGIRPQLYGRLDPPDREAISRSKERKGPDLPPLWQVFGGTKRNDGHHASLHGVASDAAVRPHLSCSI
jgi:hypothetical protein